MIWSQLEILLKPISDNKQNQFTSLQDTQPDVHCAEILDNLVMALSGIWAVMFVSILSLNFCESFRLKARFPNLRTHENEKGTKKSICPYCKYETKYYEQKVSHMMDTCPI